MKQMRFAALGSGRFANTTRKAVSVEGMDKVVPRARLCALIEPHDPDETTICRFRHLLEQHDPGRRLFEEAHIHLEQNGHLEQDGLKVAKDTILDAGIIHAPSSTKNLDQARDPAWIRPRRATHGISG